MLKLVKSLAAIALVAALWAAPDAPASAQSVSTELAADSVLETIKKRGKLARRRVELRALGHARQGRRPDRLRDRCRQEDRRGHGRRNRVRADRLLRHHRRPGRRRVRHHHDGHLHGGPSRNLTINFSNPYNWGGIGFVANKKLTGDWKLEQFDSPDVIFTVRRGSNDSIASVRKVAPSAKIRQFDDDAPGPAGRAQRHRTCLRDGRAQADQGGAPLPGPDVAADGRYAAAALALGLRRAQGRSRHPQLVAEQLDHPQP